MITRCNAVGVSNPQVRTPFVDLGIQGKENIDSYPTSEFRVRDKTWMIDGKSDSQMKSDCIALVTSDNFIVSTA